MSTISTVYDNFVSRVAAVLTTNNGWNKLPNAYAIEKNPQIMLSQGYGIGLSSGVNTKRVQSSTLSIRREFTVTIVRSIDALDFDLSTRQTTEKTLFEDLKLVIADLEGNQTLNAGQIFCEYIGDGGIEFVDGDTSEYLAIRASFATEYFETI
jgi:hypothetical protein